MLSLESLRGCYKGVVIIPGLHSGLWTLDSGLDSGC